MAADTPPSPATLEPDGRVIMLSGATGGIGIAVTRRLLEEGYVVSVGVRNMEKATQLYEGIDQDRLGTFYFDATDRDSASRWVEDTLRRFSRIDGLINNAGLLRQIDFSEGDESVLDELWEVNVKAPFRLIRLVLPHLAKSGTGRIVNVASTDGKRYREGVSVGYTMTKHAVMALSHAAKTAGWKHGVRVTALCPGAVDTELIASIPGVTPAAERIRPETVAEAVAFLLRMPNNASVAELVANSRLEATI
ncbi:MAG: SDR family NAD(P)-dependent oxidoreductase [Rhizobiaceae bacterium]|nr:SDR family NAD(P)-dependent oxidoreductase [Rhizobiaceae bacterium]